MGDPGRIEQVIDNLFGNALKHTPDGGRIELSARTEGGQAILEVANSGAGISSEHIGNVFERFYKVDQARVSGTEGSGLGLSIAKAIVERHGGRIGVVSRTGLTVFSVALPYEQVSGRTTHGSSTNLSPTPQAVSSSSGSCGSTSTFRRSRLTTVSTVRSVT